MVEKMKVYNLSAQGYVRMHGSIFRVVNNTLEYSQSITDGTQRVLITNNEFEPVEYFDDFTIGDLLKLTDKLGKFNISNSMLGTWNFKMNIELNGIHGQK